MSKTAQFQSTIQIHHDSNLWGCFIGVSHEVASPFIEHDRRVLLTFNEVHTYPCALMPDGKGDFFILINKAIRKKYNLNENDTVQCRIENDTSEYGMPMPEEFSELMLMDEEGHRFFHALTPGKQRALIHQISTAKRSDTRITRAIGILNHLKMNNGTLDFKTLREDIKNAGSDLIL